MKKGIIVNLTRFKLFNYVTLNKVIILIFAFFLSGIVLGSTLLDGYDFFISKSEWFIKNYINLHTNTSFFKKLYSCVVRYAVVLIIYYLSGTSMLGIAVTPFIVGWQGIITANIISYLYSRYALTGIAFNAVIFIPPMAIFTVCCFFAAKNSILYSFNIAKLTFPSGNRINLHMLFKEYCHKYLVYILVSLICSFLEIILNVLFLKYFKF